MPEASRPQPRGLPQFAGGSVARPLERRLRYVAFLGSARTSGRLNRASPYIGSCLKDRLKRSWIKRINSKGVRHDVQIGPSRHFAATQQCGRLRSVADIERFSVCTEPVAFDPMYGPAVRRKRLRRSGGSGLASMYPASDWSVLLRAIMDISARASSLGDRPQRGLCCFAGSPSGPPQRTRAYPVAVRFNPVREMGRGKSGGV